MSDHASPSPDDKEDSPERSTPSPVGDAAALEDTNPLTLDPASIMEEDAYSHQRTADILPPSDSHRNHSASGVPPTTNRFFSARDGEDWDTTSLSSYGPRGPQVVTEESSGGFDPVTQPVVYSGRSTTATTRSEAATEKVPSAPSRGAQGDDFGLHKKNFGSREEYTSGDHPNAGTNDNDPSPPLLRHRAATDLPVDTEAVHSALVMEVRRASTEGAPPPENTPQGPTAPCVMDSSSNRRRIENGGEDSLDASSRDEDPYTTNYTYLSNPAQVVHHHENKGREETQRSFDEVGTVSVDVAATASSRGAQQSPVYSPVEAEGDATVVMAENEHEGAEPYAITTPAQISEGPLNAEEMQLARLAIYNDTCPVSTLDFLKDTTDTILPDEINQLFSGTSTFYRNSMEFFKSTIPAPVKSAFELTSKGLLIMAEYTGDVLTNAPEYLMEIIPEGLVSKEKQKLILVDFLSTLKCYLNYKILFVPYIFQKGGLVPGLLLVLCLSGISWYTSVAFFDAKNQLKVAQQVVMYDDVPRLTWGLYLPIFSIIYNSFYFISFVLYAALNAQYLLRRMGLTDKWSIIVLSYFLPLLFCTPLVFMKRAKTQVPLASLTSLLVFIVAVLIMTRFDFKSDYHQTFGELALWPKDAPGFFIALGLALYIFSPLLLSVPVERNMHPDRFFKLSAICTVIGLLFYLAFGLTAFLYYRTTTCSVLPLSFGSTPVEVAASSLLFVTFVLVIPQSLFRVVEICDRRVLGLRRLPGYWQVGPNLMRLAFLAGAAVLASVMPHFGEMLSLSGSFGCGTLTLLIPSALDYVRRERRRLRKGKRLRWWEYCVVFSVGVLGFTVVSVGIVMGFFEMWRATQRGSDTC